MKISRILASVRITNIILPLIIVELIIFTTLPDSGNWFSSVIFLFPLLLFTLNLSACTFLRIILKKPWRHPAEAGPDLIHIGIILLILAGLLTPVVRKETSRQLSVGGTLLLPGEISLEIVELEFLTYEDGRPRQWTAVFNADGRRIMLEVNKPVRLDGLSIYLTGFGSTAEAVFEYNESLISYNLSSSLIIGEHEYHVKQMRYFKNGGWQLQLEDDKQIVTVEPGGFIEKYLFKNVMFRNEAVVMIVSNPLRPFFFISFAVIAAGLIIVLVKKFRRVE